MEVSWQEINEELKMKLLLENWRQYLTEVVGADENPDLSQDPDAFETAKKPIPLEFRVAEEDETIQTKEGPVEASAGAEELAGPHFHPEVREWHLELWPDPDRSQSVPREFPFPRPGLRRCHPL